jgi:serine/threonine-protein kinase Chk2
MTPKECTEVLRQCLSALNGLHACQPPIVHRDISPGNILVKPRDENSIYVKLADFGFTKESDDLKTLCGTRRYLAPEVYEETTYTAAVDIWALGVVVLERLSGLPDDGAEGSAWCREIARKLQDDCRNEPSHLNEFLLSMVAMDPRRRSSAHDCYNRALSLPLPDSPALVEDGCPTPKAACSVEDDDDQELGTLIPQPRRSARPRPGPWTADGGAQGAAFVRSGAPPPGSGMSALKGVRPPSSSPSASPGRRRRHGRGFSTSLAQPETQEGTKTPEGEETQEADEPTAAYLDWIRDPVHPLGGGSSLAAELGQSASDWGSTQPSMLDRSVPRTAQHPPVANPHGVRQDSSVQFADPWVDDEAQVAVAL